LIREEEEMEQTKKRGEAAKKQKWRERGEEWRGIPKRTCGKPDRAQIPHSGNASDLALAAAKSGQIPVRAMSSAVTDLDVKLNPAFVYSSDDVFKNRAADPNVPRSANMSSAIPQMVRMAQIFIPWAKFVQYTSA